MLFSIKTHLKTDGVIGDGPIDNIPLVFKSLINIAVIPNEFGPFKTVVRKNLNSQWIRCIGVKEVLVKLKYV